MVGLRFIMQRLISRGRSSQLGWAEIASSWLIDLRLEDTLLCLIVVFRASGGSQSTFFYWRLAYGRLWCTPSQSISLNSQREREKCSAGLTVLALAGINWEPCAVSGVKRCSDCRLAFTFMLNVPMKKAQVLFFPPLWWGKVYLTGGVVESNLAQVELWHSMSWNEKLWTTCVHQFSNSKGWGQLASSHAVWCSHSHQKQCSERESPRLGKTISQQN